jgi:hypothetical protein
MFFVRLLSWNLIMIVYLFSVKTKTQKKNKFRSSTVIVLKMFFFWNQKCCLFEKKIFFQEKIMICAWKSNIFDTFSVLDLTPNEKKNAYSRSVVIVHVLHKIQVWRFSLVVLMFGCFIIFTWFQHRHRHKNGWNPSVKFSNIYNIYGCLFLYLCTGTGTGACAPDKIPSHPS